MPVTINTGLLKYKNPTTGEYMEMSAFGDKFSETIAPSYSDLTFPVVSGQLCYHAGKLYISNQAISTSEDWTAAHWDETTVEEVIASTESRLNGAINAKQDAPETAGTAGQVLSLDSNLDPVWTTPQSGGGAVDDVQIDGTSIVNQGVANIPMMVNGGSSPGVAKLSSSLGISITEGMLYIVGANNDLIKAGTNDYRPIVPSRQEKAVFYGLSKLAGEDLRYDTVTVGTYPEKSKSAISQMLDAPETVSGTTPSITAKAGVRYICGEVATLTITAPASGCIDVVFQSGSTPTVLTVSSAKSGVSAIEWSDGFDETSLSANATYWLKIIDGEYGVATAWGVPSGGGNTGYTLLKNITTTEDVGYLDFDLGDYYSDIVVMISGKWTASTTGAYVVGNICSNANFAEIGQNNKAFETAEFYNNNEKVVLANIQSLSGGSYLVMVKGNIGVDKTQTRVQTNNNPLFGGHFYDLFPTSIRYFHIGSFNSSHLYEAGLTVKIWGKK